MSLVKSCMCCSLSYIACLDAHNGTHAHRELDGIDFAICDATSMLFVHVCE